jgi:thioredoxin-dependent peroxiredoxin
MASMPGTSIGTEAPDIELVTDDGESFRLSAHRGHPVVLYFYPQDDTGGCTIENIEFSELNPQFKALGAVVVGISPDTVESHCEFRDKYNLGITLAADPERRTIEAYGLWGPKKTFGREYVGLIRTTVLVDPEGTIAGVWNVNRIKGHAAEVLDATRRLLAG